MENKYQIKDYPGTPGNPFTHVAFMVKGNDSVGNLLYGHRRLNLAVNQDKYEAVELERPVNPKDILEAILWEPVTMMTGTQDEVVNWILNRMSGHRWDWNIFPPDRRLFAKAKRDVIDGVNNGN